MPCKLCEDAALAEPLLDEAFATAAESVDASQDDRLNLLAVEALPPLALAEDCRGVACEPVCELVLGCHANLEVASTSPSAARAPDFLDGSADAVLLGWLGADLVEEACWSSRPDAEGNRTSFVDTVVSSGLLSDADWLPLAPLTAACVSG